MKQYRVCEDLQGGAFGKGRVYNIYEWIEQAQAWAEADENLALAQEFDYLKDLYSNNRLTDTEVLGEITDIWAIEFEEITKEQRTLYRQYLDKYDKVSYGEPVCFEEWLDNEWEEILFDRKMLQGEQV